MWKLLGRISFPILVAIIGYVGCQYIYFSGYNKGMVEGYEACKTEQKDVVMTQFVSEITTCESGGKHDNVWGRAGEYGVAQFKKSTFNWMKLKANMPELLWNSREDQITLLTWAIENGYAKQHWRTCYQRAEKRAFASFINWRT